MNAGGVLAGFSFIARSGAPPRVGQEWTWSIRQNADFIVKPGSNVNKKSQESPSIGQFASFPADPGHVRVAPMSPVATPHRPFGKPGLSIPPVVFGTSCLGNLYAVVPPEKKRAIVAEIIRHCPAPVVLDSAG